MSLAPGTRLGPYEIVAPLGAGGMGEVYRARDTRLGRDVAIKVLPEHLSKHPEVRQRFEREARAVSSLNHPNICTLHDVGHQEGVDFLVMECLEGESLALRLKKGPLPLAEALKYAMQIADALDKAHRQGVIHRDLKPGNVMITKSGAKLLDFGLARTLEESASGAGSPATPTALPTARPLTASPTMESPLTAEGAILGTYQYMAPEQLDGRPADARSDIFAFGLLLYEMVTGRRAFQANTQASLIVAIMKEEPRPMAELLPVTPPALERLVRTCLEKDPDERRQSLHDVLLDLRWIAEGGAPPSSGGAGVAREGGGASAVADSGTASGVRRGLRGREILWIAAALIFLVATIVVGLRSEPVAPEMYSLELTNPSGMEGSIIESGVVSPSGEAIVLVRRITGGEAHELWLRNLRTGEAGLLPGTTGGHAPFWSPDSRYIAFFADGELKKIAVSGGPPTAIAEAPSPTGGTWLPDNTIVMSPNDEYLVRVSSTGGEPEILTERLPREQAHRWPLAHPDGRHILFMGDAPTREDHWLRVLDLETGEVKDIFQSITNYAFVAPDILLYVRSGSLLAQRFDTAALSLAGEPTVLAQHIMEGERTHYHVFSASQTGVLAYKAANTDATLAWIGRDGELLEELDVKGRFGNIALSPSGRRVAYETIDADGRAEDIWMLDFERNLLSRMTFHPGQVNSPVWSPDETKLAYMRATPGGGSGIYVKSLGEAEEELLFGELVENSWPQSWSPDGRYFQISHLGTGTQVDIAMLDLQQGGDLIPLVNSRFVEDEAGISPDGRWLIYDSDESGSTEIYIRRFPPTPWKLQVSTRGGYYPKWSGDSREIYYLDPTGMLTAARLVPAAGGLEVSATEKLFRIQLPGTNMDRTIGYAPAPRGDRFLVRRSDIDPMLAPMTVVLNWTRLLEAE